MEILKVGGASINTKRQAFLHVEFLLPTGRARHVAAAKLFLRGSFRRLARHPFLSEGCGCCYYNAYTCLGTR